MLVALHLDEVGVGRRQRPTHPGRLALEHLLDQLVHIERVVHGPPRANVLHRAGLQIDEREVVDAGGDGRPDLRAAAPLHRLDRVRRHVLHDVDLAREQGRHASAELGDEAEGDAARVGGPLPVIGIALDDQPVIALPLDEPERAGADRLLRQGLRALLLQRLGRHEGVGERGVVDEARPRLLGDQPHHVVVDDLYFLDRLPVRGGRVMALAGRILRVLERRLDRLGVERLAVVELDALTQRELPGGVVDDLPSGGEHRPGLEGLGVAVEQAIVDVLEHVVGRPVHDRRREHRARLGPEADHDLLAAALRPGGGRAEQDQADREHQQRVHAAHTTSMGQLSSSSVRRKLGTNVSMK